MYPSAQLKQLALEKDLLERRIAAHRTRCLIEWDRIRRPVEIADQAVMQIRRFAPLLKMLAVPLGLALARRRGRRAAPRAQGKFGLVLKWLPVALGLVRSWRSHRQMRRETETVQRRAESAVP